MVKKYEKQILEAYLNLPSRKLLTITVIEIPIISPLR